jgi:hypothetical protein
MGCCQGFFRVFARVDAHRILLGVARKDCEWAPPPPLPPSLPHGSLLNVNAK